MCRSSINSLFLNLRAVLSYSLIAAVFIATSAIFIAQMAGMNLGVGEIVTVVLTTFAASLSSAPIPSAALVLLIMVLTAIDAPLQDVTLLFAIDWFVYVDTARN